MLKVSECAFDTFTMKKTFKSWPKPFYYENFFKNSLQECLMHRFQAAKSKNAFNQLSGACWLNDSIIGVCVCVCVCAVIAKIIILQLQLQAFPLGKMASHFEN